MNLFTHILLAKKIYQILSPEIDLNKFAFLYGNIKPDLSSQCLQNPHTLDNHLFNVSNQSNRLMLQETISVKEFSLDLGVICHYICDFFCYYHLDEQLYRKLYRHFFYEIRLHFAFCSMQISEDPTIMQTAKVSQKSPAHIITEMRKEYIKKQKTSGNDIGYAIITAVMVCRSIFSSSIHTAESA